VIERYYDGPLYAVVSKTFYTPNANIYGALGLPAAYYAAHLPGTRRNMPLLARNCSAHRDGGGEPCDLRRGSGHFLRVHDTIQTGARSIFPPPCCSFSSHRVGSCTGAVGASEPLFMLVSLLMLYA